MRHTPSCKDFREKGATDNFGLRATAGTRRLDCGRMVARSCEEGSKAWLVLLFHQQDLLRIVDLSQFDLDHFIHTRLNESTHVGGFNGQLAMSPVNDDTTLHPAWASVGKERVEGGADRAAGEQHVVDQDDALVFNIQANIGFLNDRTW